MEEDNAGQCEWAEAWKHGKWVSAWTTVTSGIWREIIVATLPRLRGFELTAVIQLRDLTVGFGSQPTTDKRPARDLVGLKGRKNQKDILLEALRADGSVLFRCKADLLIPSIL